MLGDVLAGGVWTYDSAAEAWLNGFRSEEKDDCFHICTTKITFFFPHSLYSVQVYVLPHTCVHTQTHTCWCDTDRWVNLLKVPRQKNLPSNYCKSVKSCRCLRTFYLVTDTLKWRGEFFQGVPANTQTWLEGADERHGEHLPISRNERHWGLWCQADTKYRG